jgi:hypothetical protein
MGANEVCAWTRDDFPDPSSYVTRIDGHSPPSVFAAAYDEVRRGKGFVVLRGLPADRLTLDEFRAKVREIGLHFGGTLLSQNAAGEQITDVIDATASDPTPRMYRSNVELRLHTDITDMLLLACWQTARSGGTSVIASGVTIHDVIERNSPEHLSALYNGFHYHRLGEEGPDEEPVTPFRVPVFARIDGTVSVRYQRMGIAGGHQTLGVPLTEAEIAALDAFDAVAGDSKNRLAFDLERGDVMVINNYAVMHARTHFVSYPQPGRARRLIRLWPAGANFRKVPKEFNHYAGPGIPPQPGKVCTYDFSRLVETDPRATGGVPTLNLT